MALDENQLAVVLQASLHRASELLLADGGFLPFAARAKPGGEIEFVQIQPAGEAEPLGDLLGRLGDMLSAEARRNEILGSALVANAHVSGEEHGDSIAVLIETDSFSRSIVVPYRFGSTGVKLGEMTPEPAEPTVFAGAAETR